MKKTLMAVTALLFLAGTTMVSADSSSPKLSKESKHSKGHKAGSGAGAGKIKPAATGQHIPKGALKGGTVKPALNPQPLPPGIKAPPGEGGTSNK